MGMYDEVSDINVYCPRCGKLVEGTFQTKSLECCLHKYKPGDAVQTDRDIDPRYDWIEVHARCQNCNTTDYKYGAYLVSVILRVDNGILTGELC